MLFNKRENCFYGQLILTGAVFLFALINIVTIKDGHNWGDDFSSYIVHAGNLIDHRPYAAGIMLDNAVVYPPGFPLLIAPLIKILGVHYKALKLLNVVLWYLSVFIWYPIFSKRLGERWAVLCCLFLCASYFFFIFKQNVISEIPFFFFMSLTVLSFTKYIADSSQLKHCLLAMIFMALSLSIRSAGLILFVSAIFYLLAIRRDWKAGLYFVLSLVLISALQSYLVGITPGFFSVLLKASHGMVLANIFMLSKKAAAYSFVYSFKTGPWRRWR